MPTDFTTYQPPGVYIDELPQALVPAVGVDPTLIALVGPSLGYQTRTETVTLSGTTPVSVSEPGAIPSDVVVTDASDVVRDSGDYDIVATAGEDGLIGTTTDNLFTIARSSGSTLSSGSVVRVTYRYRNEAFDLMQRFDNFDDFKAVFGEPLDLETGEVQSPLSLAAYLAFANGANEIVAVPTTDSSGSTTAANINAQYARLLTDPSVNVVVPVTAGITDTTTPGGAASLTVLTNLKSHLDGASNESLFRVGIVGFDSGVVAGVSAASLAAATASQRIMLVHPRSLYFFYQNGLTNANIAVGGQYLAAAAAGLMAALRVQDSLTKKPIRGFSGLPAASLLSTTAKNTLSSGGVAVAELDRSQRLTLRHATTTKTTNITTREMSVVRARDTLLDLIQSGTEQAELIGTPIDEDTPLAVKSVVGGMLESAKNNGVIVDYLGLAVRIRSTDPSVVEVKFSYQPAYPLNYIAVTFSINVTTGESTGLEGEV